MTGRWPQLDRHVRSVAAVKAQASVFDWMLGHFVIGRSVGAFGPTDVAAQIIGQGPDVDAASNRDRLDESSRS